MSAALALLLALEPVPEVRWTCAHIYLQLDGYFSITRQLRADGRYLVDDVFWLTPFSGEKVGLAGWHVTDREPRRFLTRHLSSRVVLSRRPQGALWSVVRVAGRASRRDRIPADEAVKTDARGRLQITLLYVERRSPGGRRTPIGRPPNLEEARLVEMSVEEADGTILGTTVVPLPDWAGLRATMAKARPLLMADANGYRRRCQDERSPKWALPVAPARQYPP